MSALKEWNDFMNYMLSDALDEHRQSIEYEWKRRTEQIDEFLTTNLTADQKNMVEDVLFEFGLTTEREAEAVYRRGLRDCVFLLKELEVLV